MSFVSGASIMLAEIAAGRLVAPFFGTSTMVWAVLIGAVLGSLALGQAFGGHLARIDRFGVSPLGLGILLFGSAISLAVLPIVAPHVMRGSLSWFHSGNTGAMVASFGGITALVALPMAGLGAAGPLVLHHAHLADAGALLTSKAGAVAGRIYAWGTAGSLAGTYLSGLVFIPWIGTRSTLWLGAGALASAAIVVALRGTWRNASLTILALFLAAGASRARLPLNPRRGSVFEVESRLQYIQVTENRGTRSLYLNEGYAVQSVLALDGSASLSGVWGYYAKSAAWTSGPLPDRVLVLGLGGGSSARTIHRLLPGSRITGVELDPEVVHVARRFFDLPAEVRVIEDDARSALRRVPLSTEGEPYDIILLDAFQFPYVPFQVCTLEMFRELEHRLSPGGVIVVNLGRDLESPDPKSRDVVNAVANTLGQVLPVLRAVDVPSHPNTIVVGTRHQPAQDRGVAALPLAVDVAAVLNALPELETMRIPRETPVLTDDWAPVEWMTDRIVLRHLWAVLRGAGRT